MTTKQDAVRSFADQMDSIPSKIFTDLIKLAHPNEFSFYASDILKPIDGQPDSIYAFPCAHSYLYHPHGLNRDVDVFVKAAQKAHFLVFTSEYFRYPLLGIDGGGYDFIKEHFEPLYDELGLQWHDSDTD